MARVDYEAALNDVWPVAGCTFEHSTKIDFVESTILHPLEDVGTQFKLPTPPVRPRSWCQNTSLGPPCALLTTLASAAVSNEWAA